MPRDTDDRLIGYLLDQIDLLQGEVKVLKTNPDPSWYPKYHYPNGMNGLAVPNTPYSPTDSVDSPQP